VPALSLKEFLRQLIEVINVFKSGQQISTLNPESRCLWRKGPELPIVVGALTTAALSGRVRNLYQRVEEQGVNLLTRGQFFPNDSIMITKIYA
jgi:hypothetical protein